MPEVVQLLLLMTRYRYTYIVIIRKMCITKICNEDCILSHCVLFLRNIVGEFIRVTYTPFVNELRKFVKLQISRKK